MHFKIVTLFPEIFNSFFSAGLLHKALQKKIIDIECINFRKYGLGKHLKVDDSPYGGGPGMLLRLEPIVKALREIEQQCFPKKVYRILISPQGSTFTQKKIHQLFEKKENVIVLICGRYEGFDERIRSFVDEEISLGDFILLGGEVPAMAIIEGCVRLIPSMIGNYESVQKESFSTPLLEYDQYTKPYKFEGFQVPDVLMSGNHKQIEKWRVENSIQKTKNKRPDLLKQFLDMEKHE